MHRSLTAHIRELADKRGIQLAHLPDLAGVGRSHFWNVLKGRASPTVRWLDSIAQALEVPITTLLEPRPAPPTFAAKRSKRYETDVPLYSLEAAASSFSGSQDVAPQNLVRLRSGQRDATRLFIGRVRGKSMEPTIPSGSHVLFRAAPVANPDGKVVLVELRGHEDPETGGRYTVKRLRRRQRRIELQPENPRFEALTFSPDDGDGMRLIAEMVDLVDAV